MGRPDDVTSGFDAARRRFSYGTLVTVAGDGAVRQYGTGVFGASGMATANFYGLDEQRAADAAAVALVESGLDFEHLRRFVPADDAPGRGAAQAERIGQIVGAILGVGLILGIIALVQRRTGGRSD